MNSPNRISKSIQDNLLCPSTKSKLRLNGDYFENVDNVNIRYPIIDGIPILINAENSIFSVDDFINRKNTTFDMKESQLKKMIKMLFPSISNNIRAKKNYSDLVGMLPKPSKILVIGGSVKGEGMDLLYSDKAFDVVGSDVSFGPYVKVISDAHDIPFEDGIFDCVIIQAVLEHVLEPQRCVDEVHRVLKEKGLVYAETPFMQQVHMKQYDFTRYTHLGHRRLFRRFEETSSGPNCGPGMALAWSYTYFLRSLSASRRMTRLLTIFGYLTSFYFKYFDYLLIDKPGSYDAASGFYFMGKKSRYCLTDKELIAQFKGVK